LSIRVAIVGATGYAGAELVRLLEFHPEVSIVAVTSSRSAGRPLRDECPWLATDLVLTQFDPQTVEADFVVLCQEAGFAMSHAGELLERCKVIDLSADFRLLDSDAYEKYYKRPHTAPDLNPVYGLPELSDRRAIAQTRLLANPGCYPTATLLALMPLQRAGIAVPDAFTVVDAKSGVSGAGRSKKDTDFLFSELDGGFKAYALTGHRHTPEIEQLYGSPVRFTPHLLPVPRGLEVTAHVPLEGGSYDLPGLYRDFYKDEAFVHVQDAPPSTKQVLGSNTCAIHVAFDEHTQSAVVLSVIDNLVKGAAGQAIQNMNLMAGLPEGLGLPKSGLWP
jgi:N-acetyl-gamma-glutamyl-phosphate reductase